MEKKIKAIFTNLFQELRKDGEQFVKV